MTSQTHSLDTISVEVVDLVLAYLPRTDLLSVALVARRLLPRAQVFLYRNIEVKNILPLIRLWRTFLRRPDLALLCHEARIFLHEPSAQLSDDRLATESPSEHVYLSPVQDAKNSQKSSVNGLETCLAYTLSCLANMRLLDVATHTGKGVSEAYQIISGANRFSEQTCAFEHLRGATIVARELDKPHFDLPEDSQDVLAFLNLPRLQQFKVRVFSKAMALQPQPTEPLSAGLRELVLSRGSCITFPLLNHILERTRRLETLEYHFTAEWDKVGELFFESALLASCLLPVRHSLRRLHISCMFLGDLEGLHWLSNEPWGFKGQLTSLQEFHELRHLVIPLVVLAGYDPSQSEALGGKLPERLQSLRVLDDCSNWQDFEWEPPELEDKFKRFLNGDGCPEGLGSLELNVAEDQDWPWIPSVMETLQLMRPETVVKITHY